MNTPTFPRNRSRWWRKGGLSVLLLGVLVVTVPCRAADEAGDSRTERLLETILRTAPSGIGLVQHRVIMEVNDYVLDLTGYTREELIGQNAKMLYPTQKEFDDVGAEKYRQIGEFGTGSVETRWQRKDGEIRDVLLSSTPLHPADLSAGVTFTVLDITGRKQAERKLAEAHLFQQSLLDAVPVAVFYKDHEGRYLGCNSVFSDFMGISSEMIAGKTVHELWPSELAEVYHKADLDLMETAERQIYEFTVRDRDGVLRPVIFGKQVFHDAQGNVAGLVGAFVDITEQKQATAALVKRTRWFLAGTSLFSLVLLLLVFRLIASMRRQRIAEAERREAEKNYRDIFDASSGAIFVHDPETGNILDVNRRMLSLYGYADKETALQCSIEKLSAADGGYNEAEIARRIRAAAATGFQSFEWRARKTTGECFWAQVSLSTMTLRGRERILAEVRDISDRKQMEEALRASEERLDLAMMVKNEGIWDWTLPTNKTLFDDRYYTMAGYVPDEFPQDFDAWAEHVHPDDLDATRGALHAYLNGESERFKTEFRFRHKNGSWIWIRGEGKIVTRGVDGTPLRMIGTHADITDRKQAEEALRKSEEKLAATLLSIGDGVITANRSGCVETMNPVAEALTGWREEEARGQPLTAVFDILSEDTGEPVTNPVVDVFAQGRIVGLANHTLLRHRDGTLYPIADSAAPILIAGEMTGAVLVFRDQTAEREQQRRLQESHDTLERKVEARTRALRESERQLKEAQRIGKTGHWDYDIAADVLHWSEQTYRIYDVDPASFVVNYANAVALFHPDDRENVERAWQEAVWNHKPMEIEHRIVTPAHEVRHIVERVVVTYDEDGTPLNAIGSVTDVTEAKILEAQLIRSERLAAVGTLVGGIAHEFNNINVPVVGYADLLLQSGHLEGEALEYAERIKRAGLRAKEITLKLLTASGFRDGAFCIGNLVDVAKEAIDLARSAAEGDGITLVRHLHAVPATRMIPGQVMQVILNLLINAQHALLEAPTRTIMVTTGADTVDVWVRVKDTGCGIPERDLTKIFSPFFSRKGEHAESASPLQNVRGTGLGLSVSHSIIESHGGRIEVSSVLGEGSIFTVYIPQVESAIETESMPESMESEVLPIPSPNRSGDGASILVVDDEPDTGVLIHACMEPRGHAVETCTDPEVATKRIREGQYDLVILDYQMPGMSAADILHAVEDTPSSPPFIILSGHPPERIHQATKDHRVKAVVRKPFILDELMRTMEELLSM